VSTPCEACDGTGRVEVGPIGLHERWEERRCDECLGAGYELTHADCARWCDAERGRLCPACKRQMEAEREDARRLYEGTPKPLDSSYGTPEEQMRDAGRGHLVRER
jgi:RecJ-like exonuclease